MNNLRQYSTRFPALAVVCAMAGVFLMMSLPAFAQPHVIEILADKDSRFKIGGKVAHQIVVKAGEPILLRIEARRGKTWSRDGAVHGFTLLRAKDHAKVPGWDLELMPGKQEFSLTAPTQPGEYVVMCTVICSDDHEGMRMKFLVEP
jgi:heme/copper-type cytochrome/quinol oxidase subunit 2